MVRSDREDESDEMESCDQIVSEEVEERRE